MPTIADLARTARQALKTPLGDRAACRLDALKSLGPVDSLPYCIKVLLESCLRHFDGRIVTEEHIKALVNYDATKPSVLVLVILPASTPSR